MKKGFRSEIKKTGPLKLATLNGLTLARMPVADEVKDEHGKASNDDRVGMKMSFEFMPNTLCSSVKKIVYII